MMSNTVAEETINPFNKDAKYEARLRTWRGALDRQNASYERIESFIHTQKDRRAYLQSEERKLTDKQGPRAQLIKAELKEVGKEIQIEQRDLNWLGAGREAILDERRFLLFPQQFFVFF